MLALVYVSRTQAAIIFAASKNKMAAAIEKRKQNRALHCGWPCSPCMLYIQILSL
jgi:hypothetical protein